MRKKVQELLDKGLIREGLCPCVVRTVLSQNEVGEWRMCTDSRAINKIVIDIFVPRDMEHEMPIITGILSP